MTAIREIPFGRPWIEDEERNAVIEVLHGHVLTHGPQCKAFEESFQDHLGGGHCLTVSSCTAGLHLIYMHYGIGPGDEVIVPSQTHTATAHAVEFVGARPVFCDCEPETGNMRAAQIEALITEKTKAVSIVHYLGIPCQMQEIVELTKKHNLILVEDSALGVGTVYDDKPAGLWGDAAAFSFYPVKHITTAEGGMVVTKHQDVYDSISKLRAFGVDRTFGERKIPGLYDVIMLGYNYRMSEVQAAIGIQQMKRVPEILKRRRENFAALKNGLSDIPNIHILDVAHEKTVSSHYCLSIVLQGDLASKRNDVILRLNELGVGTSVYYPQPVPRMTYYQQKYGYDASRYTQATIISDQSIALPVGPHLNQDDMQYVVQTVQQVITEFSS
jgi:dTDP-4-amino-4,6-dideoxygalactose transaminase